MARGKRTCMILKEIRRQIAEANDIELVITEHHPTFPGINKYLAENLRYPDTDKEGRVVVSFFVETDGSLTDITVVRGIAKELDEEAVRVVKSMPKWIPGEMNGHLARIRFTLPVVFKKGRTVEKQGSREE